MARTAASELKKIGTLSLSKIRGNSKRNPLEAFWKEVLAMDPTITSVTQVKVTKELEAKIETNLKNWVHRHHSYLRKGSRAFKSSIAMEMLNYGPSLFYDGNPEGVKLKDIYRV